MKRFTETEKWNDPWFRRLSPDLKCFWLFVLDNCDLAGVWKVDMEIANFFICGSLTEEQVFASMPGRFKKIDNSHWHVTKFIPFQYGELKPDCRPHQAVIRILKKNSLLEGYWKGINTLQDKDKDKDKDRKGSAEGKPNPIRFPNGIPDSEWLEELCHDPTYQGIDVKREHGKMLNWCKTHGSTPTRRRFINWLNRAEKPMTGTAGGTYPKGWSQKQIAEYEEAQKKYG